MRSLSPSPLAVIGFVILSLIVLAIVDAYQGHARYYHGSITNHRYVAGYFDSDHRWHSEEFHLGCVADKDEATFDIGVEQEVYNSLQDGTPVWIKVREGWTGINYCPRIVDGPPAPEN